MVTIEERPALRTGRLLTCMGLSLVVHLLGMIALAVLAWKPWIPKIEVTWLDLDNTFGAPRPVPKPAKKLRPEPKKPKPKQRRVRPKPEHPSETVAMATASKRPDAGVPPRPDSGPPSAPVATTQKAISNLAPGDAALMLLMRNDRILGSPYESEVRRLLQVFYDHKTLMWTSDLDPMKDFDALLVATPNPYRVTQTFLAARYKIPRAKLKRALERSARFKNKRLRWIRLKGKGSTLRGEIPSPPKLPHDRRVVLLRDQLVLLTDPKHSQQLSAAMTPTQRSDAGAPVQSWLDHLGQMGEVGGAAGTEGPGMILVAVNLPRLVRLPRDMPTPLSLSVTVPATDPTEVKGLMLFSDDKQAKRFLAAVPARIRRAKRSLLLRFLGVTDLLEGIRLKREKERVLASTSLDRTQVRSLLELFRGMIPQVRVPGMPPRLPPDAGVSKPDAGPPDSSAPRTETKTNARKPDAGPDT